MLEIQGFYTHGSVENKKKNNETEAEKYTKTGKKKRVQETAVIY